MYLDPETGGTLFTILAAAVCGIPLVILGVVAAVYLRKRKKDGGAGDSKDPTA